MLSPVRKSVPSCSEASKKKLLGNVNIPLNLSVSYTVTLLLSSLVDISFITSGVSL